MSDDTMVERVKAVLAEHGLDACSETTLTLAARAAIEEYEKAKAEGLTYEPD